MARLRALAEPLKPAVPIKRSITPEYLVCLEDGKKFKSLKRHLRTQYQMTPDQYRAKWNLPPDYPMVAPNYATARSQLAKQMGLGERAALAPRKLSMTDYFQRQLAHYADAHRDQVNSVMHIIGNPLLFVAVVLPLCLLPVSVFGVQISAAPLLVIPALILWIAWDVAIGLALVITSIFLLFAAAAIVGRVSVPWVWIIAVGLFVVGWALQILGHQVFERRRPTLLDNPVQMLISPMYIFAKFFIALGFRADLAAVLQKSSGRRPVGFLPYPIEDGADVDKTA